MYGFIQFCMLVFVLSGDVYAKECSDCVNVYQCPEAVELARNNRTAESMQFFRDAFCGTGQSDKNHMLKVCCSLFSPIRTRPYLDLPFADDPIANHVNLKLLPESCGINRGRPMLGGLLANLYEFPWIALIAHQTREGILFKCGGSIINKRYVLTAAHCVRNKRIAGVRVGEYNINSHVDCQNNVCETHIQDIEVERTVIHENYTGLPILANDIALVRLKNDVDFNHSNVAPICLPTTSDMRRRVLSNQTAEVAGWGLDDNDSDVLRKTVVPIVSAQQCNYLYNSSAEPGDSDEIAGRLCAGSITENSCIGDSGGPLMLGANENNMFRYFQYGIVTHGPRQCGSDYPGVYTDVTKYMGWILDNITP